MFRTRLISGIVLVLIALVVIITGGARCWLRRFLSYRRSECLNSTVY